MPLPLKESPHISTVEGEKRSPYLSGGGGGGIEREEKKIFRKKRGEASIVRKEKPYAEKRREG